MHKPNTAAALAWVAHWYATPDAQPPGTWEALEALMAAHPIDLGSPEDGGALEPGSEALERPDAAQKKAEGRGALKEETP